MVWSPVVAAAVAARDGALRGATPFRWRRRSCCRGSPRRSLAYWLSLPVGRARPPARAPDERARLRRTARKTWRYFETFVTEADGWLAPDNFQEGEAASPGAGAAHVAHQHRR